MALSASINTGLLADTTRAAGAIKGELAEQVSLLERAVALQARLRESSGGQLGRYIASRGGSARPQDPAWSWVPSGQLSTTRGLPTAVVKDQAKREFRSLLNDEIRAARSRAQFESGVSMRQATGRARALLNLAQGQMPTPHDLKDVGESFISLRGGKMQGARMAALDSAFQTIAPLAAWGMMAADAFVGAHELGARFGKASGALDLQLRKSFRNMSRRDAVDLGSRINEMVDVQNGGRIGSSFAARLDAALKARKNFQDEVLRPILGGDPQKSGVALDMAINLARNNYNLTRKSPHNIRGRPDAIDHAMRGLITEQRGNVMSHAAEILKYVESHAQHQRREFDNNAQMAGDFHDQMRMKRKLEKFEYEDKQRDWGSAL